MQLSTLEKYSHIEKKVTSPGKFRFTPGNIIVWFSNGFVGIMIYLSIFVVQEKLSEGSILVFGIVVFNL